MKINLFVVMLIVASLTGCTRTEKPLPVKSKLFDFGKHFEDEIKELSAAQAQLIKTLEKEGKTETLEVQHPDWKKELQSFLDLDLNKPALAGSYNVDTLSLNPQHVRYTASDSTTVIRNADFYGTDSIVVQKRISNMYYTSSEQLIYHANGYMISAFIRPKAGKSLAFNLNAVITKNH